MDKYINKEETIERINRLFTKNHDGSVAKNDYNSGLYAAKAEIVFITAADVQPIVYAHKTINVGRRSYCSNCGKLAIMEDFCSKCGAKVEDGDTECKDNCFNCECGGAEATKDLVVTIHNVQRVCEIIGSAADTDEGEYIAEVIRNNLERMVETRNRGTFSCM